MNTNAINEARKPSRIGSLAVISGTLLCAAGAAVPAFAADLPDDDAYRPAPGAYYRSSYYDSGYNNGCYRCSCCGRSFAPVADRYRVEERVRYPVAERQVIERPIVERVPVAERHWVQRDYIERRYPSYAASARYADQEYPAAYREYPGHYHYSYYYPGSGAESYTAYEPGPDREPVPPLRRFAYEGGAYSTGQASYEYDGGPHPQYRFAAATQPYDYFRPAYEHQYRPVYEYERSPGYESPPRPPMMLPGGHYYHHGY